MKPYAKVIQMIKDDSEYGSNDIFCLCEDGSMWRFSTLTLKWILLAEMGGEKYV